LTCTIICIVGFKKDNVEKSIDLKNTLNVCDKTNFLYKIKPTIAAGISHIFLFIETECTQK
jgi:hypothetical protein